MIDENTTVSAAELGRILNLTTRRIRQLAEDGQFERVDRGKYPLAACVQTYIATISSAAEPEDLQRARLDLVKTQRRKLEQMIRDREAVGRDLDWQDAMIRAVTFEAQMRIRLMASWLHTELAGRNLTMDGARDALTEVCHLVSGWSGGIRRELEAAFLGAARVARRKQRHLDSWERVVEFADLAAVEGDDDDDDARNGSAHAGNGRDIAGGR